MGRKTHSKTTRRTSKSLIGRAIENTLSNNLIEPIGYAAPPSEFVPITKNNRSRVIENVSECLEDQSILEVSNPINEFCDLLADVVSKYQSNSDIVHKTDLEICDLLHEIELLPSVSAKDGYNYYKKLREARLRRRAAKTENIMLSPIYDYVNSHSFSVNEIMQLQEKCSKVSSDVRNYHYVYRLQEDPTSV